MSLPRFAARRDKLKPADELALHLKGARIAHQREYRFHPVRKWLFDFAMPEKLVAVECQGGVYIGGRHATGTGITKDCEKFSVAASMGWRVMPVTPAQIRSGEALQWIEAALA